MRLVYCFISHNSVVSQDYDRIKEMMYELGYDDYFIFYGGERHIENGRIVHLHCDDSYCGLPDKINKVYKYINLHTNISHIIKLDRTTFINNLIPTTDIENIDYAGIIRKFSIPNYHFKKCEPSSKWYKKEFNGDSILYCSGGGYILSKKSINLMAEDNSFTNHVYEDYYVGYVLKQYGILPQIFPIQKYIYDHEHKRLFS